MKIIILLMLQLILINAVKAEDDVKQVEDVIQIPEVKPTEEIKPTELTWQEKYWNASDVWVGLYYMTDAVDRGISGSNSKPAFLTYTNVNYGPFYANVMYLNRDFGEGINVKGEYDYLLGVKPQFGPITLDLTAYYIDLSPTDAFNYAAVYVGATYNHNNKTMGTMKYYWTDNILNSGRVQTAYEFMLFHSLNPQWSLNANFGHRDVEKQFGTDHQWFQVGVAYQLSPSVGLDVKYKTSSLRNDAQCYPAGSCDDNVFFALRFDQSLRNILSKK